MQTSPYTKSALFIEDHLTIIDKNGKEVPFKLNEMQQKFVEEASGKDIILKGRQMGFSSFILGAFTKDFIFTENSLSVVIADIADNAQDLLARVKHYIRSFEEKNNTKVPLKYNSKYELQNAFNNARYIIGTAENTEFGRSKTITNLHMSEAAFYKHFRKLHASAGTALTPTGRFVIETTANGFNEFKSFWDESVLDETGFKPHFYTSHGFYPPEYIESERKRLGRLFDQEHPSTPQIAFITSGQPVFEQEAMKAYLEEAKDPSVPLPPHLDKDMFTLHRPLRKGEFICFFLDTAGEGSDYNAGHGLSKTNLDIPITLHYRGSVVDVTPRLKEMLDWIFKETGVKPVACYETNNGGGYELERLDRLNSLQSFTIYRQYTLDSEGNLVRTDKKGWNTSSQTRPPMLKGLEDVVNNHLVTIYSSKTVNEMFSFVKKQTPTGWRAEAEVGSNDDLMMSLGGVWQLYQTENPIIKKVRTRAKPPRARFHV